MSGSRLLLRRGSILFGVLLVVVLATLVATTAMYRVRNNTDIVRTSIREDSSRALLRSGLRVLLTEFEAARPDLLRGGVSLDPDSAAASPLRISEGYVISEIEGRRGIVRLLAHPDDQLAMPESARIDLNRAPRDTLLALPGVTEPVADAIIARRSGRPFESVEELLTLEEVTPELLFGDLEQFARRYRPADEALEDRTAQAQTLLGEAVLVDLVTVYSADPSVRSALDSAAADTVGAPRFVFPGDVISRDGDTLVIAEAAREFLTPDEAQRMEGATDEQSLLRRVLSGIAPERRALLLDAVTMSPDPFVLGRVDLTNAPEPVLGALPGLDEDLVAEIMTRRAGLSEARLASIVWPLDEGIITGEQFLEIAPWITTRSLQFRVIIEAGFEVPTEGPRSGDFATLELAQRVVAEAVIDIAGDTPRFAYIRDVTWLAEALQIHSTGMEERNEDPEQWYDFADPFAPLAGADGPEDDGSSFERPGNRADLVRRDLRRNRPQLGADQPDTPTEQVVPAVQPATPEGRDRRIGRWNGTPRSGAGR